jgi:hypothetical protein
LFGSYMPDKLTFPILSRVSLERRNGFIAMLLLITKPLTHRGANTCVIRRDS